LLGADTIDFGAVKAIYWMARTQLSRVGKFEP
jgi:hypothetical protein